MSNSQHKLPKALRKRHPLIATLSRRPVALAVLILATMLIGTLVTLPVPGVTIERIELSLLPNGFESRDFRVEVPLRSRDTNLSPSQVEKDVTLPIEGELATIPGIERLSAESDRNGASFRLSFASGTDLDDAYAQIHDRVERAKRLITQDLGQVRYRRWSGTSMPIAWMSVRFDESVKEPFDKVAQRIIPALESVDGVSDVSVWGDISPYYRIALYQDKMSLYDVGDLNQRLSSDNFSRPVGEAAVGDSTVFIVVNARLRSLEELRNFQVKQGLALKDVADVREASSSSANVFGFNWDSDDQEYDGGRGVFLPISKTSDANAVVTSERITEAIEALKADPTLDGFSYHMAFNQGEEIVSQLLILLETVAIGGVLAVLVLLLFLKRARLALIIALSIPLSMMMALIVMYFLGEILSAIALMGFTIVAGMLLDNAIVVSENIYRRFDIEENHAEASVAGAGEVGMALTLATSTTIIVFFAIGVAGGNEEMLPFLKALGYPICFSLIFSVFVALAVIPYTMAKVFGATNKKSKQDPRELYHRSYRRVASIKILGPVATIPMRLLLGRPPELLANTSAGDWVDRNDKRKKILQASLIVGGVIAGYFLSLYVFASLGGETPWSIFDIDGLIDPIAEELAPKEKGSGGWGNWGKKSVGPHPSLMAIATFFGTALLPLLFLTLLPRKENASSPSPWIGRLNVAYTKAIQVISKRVGFSLILLLFVMYALGVGAFGLVKQTKRNQGQNGQMRVWVSFPANLEADVGEGEAFSPDAMYFLKTRQELFGIPMKPDVSKEEAQEMQRAAFAKYGISSGSIVWSARSMNLRINLDETRSEEFSSLAKAIKKGMPEMAEFKVSGGFDMSELNKIRIQLRGPEFGKLSEIATTLAERLENSPVVSNVDAGDNELGYGEAALIIDRAKANSYGVTPESTAQLASFMLNGTQAPDFRDGTIVRPIRILMDAPFGREGKQRDPTFSDIMSARTFGDNGNPTISAIANAELKHIGSSRPIRRIDQQTTLTISANPVGRSDEIRGAVSAMLEEIDLPAGYTAETQEGSQGRRRGGRRRMGGGSENSQMFFAGIAALLLIGLVMGFLFESVAMPFVVALACLPGAIFGGYWALILTDTTFDGICFLGLIILIGVSVNNGIVLVDLILRLRKEGLARASAVIEACTMRMRPVLMTSVTTCVGLIPMAMGEASFVGSPYFPLGRTILGGILLSTMVTLFAIPIFYLAIDSTWATIKQGFADFVGVKD